MSLTLCPSHSASQNLEAWDYDAACKYKMVQYRAAAQVRPHCTPHYSPVFYKLGYKSVWVPRSPQTTASGARAFSDHRFSHQRDSCYRVRLWSALRPQIQCTPVCSHAWCFRPIQHRSLRQCLQSYVRANAEVCCPSNVTGPLNGPHSHWPSLCVSC